MSSKEPALRSLAGQQQEILRTAFAIIEQVVAGEDRLPERVEGVDGALADLVGLELGASGHDIDEVVEALRRVLLATPSSASPRFFNQLFGGRDPAASLADLLVPITNTSMYTFKVAGPQVLVEAQVLGRLAALVGYENGEGTFTPGGSLANLTAMMIARNEAVPSARDDGLGERCLVVYTSEHGHYSIRKNAGMLGLGRNNVRDVPADQSGRMLVGELTRMIGADRDAGRLPMMINATAGTTVLGAFDPISEIADVAAAHGIWLHVDGALGGSVLLSGAHRHLLDGCERADSFAWNAHKMMGVPLSCSAVLLKETGLLDAHLNESATYLFQADADHLNPGTRSIQCGRRNDALKLWAAWLYHGDRGYEARIDRLFELARHAAQSIARDPELELVAEPESINVCFQVKGVASDAICDHLDSHALLKIGHGEVGDRQAIRLVCINPDLDEAGIDRVLNEVKAAAAVLRDRDGGPRPTLR